MEHFDLVAFVLGISIGAISGAFWGWCCGTNNEIGRQERRESAVRKTRKQRENNINY